MHTLVELTTWSKDARTDSPPRYSNGKRANIKNNASNADANRNQRNQAVVAATRYITMEQAAWNYLRQGMLIAQIR